MYPLFILISTFAIGWTIISIIGCIFYKLKLFNVKTWEEGITCVLTYGAELIFEEITGEPSPYKIVDSSLILTNDEVMLIVHKLTNHPFDTPTLVSYRQDSNKILWVNIESIGLVSTYRELSNEDISKMAQHIIQNFFLETRKFHANLTIKIASPQRLYLAIPLTQEAQRFLLSQNTSVKTELESVKKNEPLIEEIADLSDDDPLDDE